MRTFKITLDCHCSTKADAHTRRYRQIMFLSLVVLCVSTIAETMNQGFMNFDHPPLILYDDFTASDTDIHPVILFPQPRRHQHFPPDNRRIPNFGPSFKPSSSHHSGNSGRFYQQSVTGLLQQETWSRPQYSTLEQEDSKNTFNHYYRNFKSNNLPRHRTQRQRNGNRHPESWSNIVGDRIPHSTDQNYRPIARYQNTNLNNNAMRLKSTPINSNNNAMRLNSKQSNTKSNAIYLKSNPYNANRDTVHLNSNPSNSNNNAIHLKSTPTNFNNNAIRLKSNPSDANNNAIYLKSNPSNSNRDTVYLKSNPSNSNRDTVYLKSNPSNSNTNAIYLEGNPRNRRPLSDSEILSSEILTDIRQGNLGKVGADPIVVLPNPRSFSNDRNTLTLMEPSIIPTTDQPESATRHFRTRPQQHSAEHRTKEDTFSKDSSPNRDLSSLNSHRLEQTDRNLYYKSDPFLDITEVYSLSGKNNEDLNTNRPLHPDRNVLYKNHSFEVHDLMMTTHKPEIPNINLHFSNDSSAGLKLVTHGSETPLHHGRNVNYHSFELQASPKNIKLSQKSEIPDRYFHYSNNSSTDLGDSTHDTRNLSEVHGNAIQIKSAIIRATHRPKKLVDKKLQDRKQKLKSFRTVKKEEDASSIPGSPGLDYPVYQEVPFTNFKCRDAKVSGFYADIETRCQVFHKCDSELHRHSFLCPNGTVFRQELLICDWWYNVRCEDAHQYYP